MIVTFARLAWLSLCSTIPSGDPKQTGTREETGITGTEAAGTDVAGGREGGGSEAGQGGPSSGPSRHHGLRRLLCDLQRLEFAADPSDRRRNPDAPQEAGRASSQH